MLWCHPFNKSLMIFLSLGVHKLGAGTYLVLDIMEEAPEFSNIGGLYYTGVSRRNFKKTVKWNSFGAGLAKKNVASKKETVVQISTIKGDVVSA